MCSWLHTRCLPLCRFTPPDRDPGQWCEGSSTGCCGPQHLRSRVCWWGLLPGDGGDCRHQQAAGVHGLQRNNKQVRGGLRFHPAAKRANAKLHSSSFRRTDGCILLRSNAALQLLEMFWSWASTALHCNVLAFVSLSWALHICHDSCVTPALAAVGCCLQDIIPRCS
jgi:hypothetical protein